MVSLLDIAPASVKKNTVPVQGQDVEVHGVSIAGIAYLIQHYPEVKDLFSGKDIEVNFDAMLEGAPNLLYAIIAVGTTGVDGVDEALPIVAALPVSEQVDLLDGVLKETFKGGLGPFVKTVQRLLGVVQDVGSKVSDSSGPKPPKR